MNQIRSTVLAGLAVLLLAACAGGEPLPSRRTVDPLTLLYSGANFPGAGDFANMQVDLPADNFDVKGRPHAVVKIWRGSAPQVHEQVTVHNSADDAEQYFRRHDPRKAALDLLTPDRLVGESQRYAAPGDPDRSQTYCEELDPNGHGQCASWVWWARYGQYTVTLQAGLGPSEHHIDRDQFNKVVDLASAHIGEQLDPKHDDA